MKIVRLLAALMVLVSFAVQAEERGTIRPQALVGATPAAAKELDARNRAFLIAPIKSEVDLKEHLDLLELTSSPLKALSYEARQRFVQSLKFNETGLTSFNYADLQKELNAVQTYKILALFGKQHVTYLVKNENKSEHDKGLIGPMIEGGGLYPDYQDYQCSKRATCSRSISEICMSGC